MITVVEFSEQYTSLKLAEISGKRHKNILSDIRDESDKIGYKLAGLIFQPSKYTDTTGRKLPMYYLSKKGWLQMGARYDAITRYTIIDYADKLEKEREIPKSFSEALLLASKQAEKIEQQQRQLEQQKPAVVFAETVKGSKNSILVREFAKLLQKDGIDIGQNRLYQWLRDNKYLMKNNEPYQNYIGRGLFEVIERVVGDADSTITVKTTKITGKGQIYFTEKLIGSNSYKKPLSNDDIKHIMGWDKPRFGGE